MRASYMGLHIAEGWRLRAAAGGRDFACCCRSFAANANGMPDAVRRPSVTVVSKAGDTTRGFAGATCTTRGAPVLAAAPAEEDWFKYGAIRAPAVKDYKGNLLRSIQVFFPG